MVVCGCGKQMLKKNLSRHKRSCAHGGVSAPIAGSVRPVSSVNPAIDELTRPTFNTPQGVVYGIQCQPTAGCVDQYFPSAVSTLLKSAILGAVLAILDRHGAYSEQELSIFVDNAFPAIPQQLCGPMILAATAAAKHTALTHVVHASNLDSHDEGKRTFAKEAASALSFWALGLRPPPRQVHQPPASTKDIWGETPLVRCEDGSQDVVTAAQSYGPNIVSDDEVRRILSNVQFPVMLNEDKFSRPRPKPKTNL